MATTAVSICNSALAKVGAETIISLTDNNERARLCNAQYEKNRDDLLRSHPWNFATRRVELAVLNTTPEYEFDYQFQLPSDCLRVLETDLPKDMDWKIEGRYILCNTNELRIKYIAKETDAAKFDSNFVEALASKIAADISYSLVQSVTLRDQLIREAQDKLRYARSYDAQESRGDRTYADTWLNSRL